MHSYDVYAVLYHNCEIINNPNVPFLDCESNCP